jgi:S1-C subfamily serine protease
MAILLAAWLLAPAAGAAHQDPADGDLRKVHVKVHKEVAPGIVGIRDAASQGTGIVIHRAGWILTSLAALRPRSGKVQVYLRGHVRVEGTIVERFPDLEAALVKIAPDKVAGVVEIGDSDEIGLGRICYTLGDSFDSIFVDDQVAISVGVVSARYDLKAPHGRSKYTGPVIETSAAVNPNQDGGALVDRDGRLIGMITMNYDDSKFAGVAIPIQRLLPAISKRVHSEAGEPWLGWTLDFVAGTGAVVSRVSPDGPAARAGVREGDRVAKFGSGGLTSSKAYAKALSLIVPGDEVDVAVVRGGRTLALRLKADVKEFY